MSSLAFDTHQAVKNLLDAGAEEKLAEVMVTTIGTAINDHVATKSDIKDVQSDIKAVQSDIKAVRGDIKNVQSDIKDVQSDIKDVRGDIKNVQSDIKVVQSDIKATKSDIKDVQSDIKAVRGDIDALRLATEFGLKDLNKTMTIRLGFMLFAGLAAMATILEVLK
ncbi:coiled-coil domain-containing protein [Candidatus Spongiihabitans sp.]|uniref:coiled-coil domain-containing protein n=1 Tax=Candidatus Spongiihabitans sp. TaxID=3101308 RepID=UPI003C7A2938